MKSKDQQHPFSNQSSTPAVITVAGFCAATTLGRTKFYTEVAASRIRILKAGRRTLVPYTEIQAYLELLAGNRGNK